MPNWTQAKKYFYQPWPKGGEKEGKGISEYLFILRVSKYPSGG
jgi:hypothetical protein